MERAAWTDERLNDLSRRVDARFDCVDARFDRVDARFERVDARFDRVERDIRDLRVEMGQRFDTLHHTMIRFGGAMIVCLLGAIVAVSLGGS